jgi:hypothetical protein
MALAMRSRLLRPVNQPGLKWCIPQRGQNTVPSGFQLPQDLQTTIVCDVGYLEDRGRERAE